MLQRSCRLLVIMAAVGTTARRYPTSLRHGRTRCLAGVECSTRGGTATSRSTSNTTG